MEIGRARQRLRLYRALDSEARLKALKAISEKPNTSFNEVSRKVEVERGLLAYHLGVLKAAGIISVDYQRRSKETSKYKLTKTGEELLQEVFTKAEPNKRHSASRTKKLPKNRGTPK
jgi:predicted transcriptional regulator